METMEKIENDFVSDVEEINSLIIKELCKKFKNDFKHAFVMEDDNLLFFTFLLEDITEINYDMYDYLDSIREEHNIDIVFDFVNIKYKEYINGKQLI